MNFLAVFFDTRHGAPRFSFAEAVAAVEYHNCIPSEQWRKECELAGFAVRVYFPT